MSYFHDPNYVKDQFSRLSVDQVLTGSSEGAGDGIARRFFNWGIFTASPPPLHVLQVDIVSSTAFTENEKKLIDPFCLFVATDITARGGFVFHKTDGVEALFKDERRALESALSLHRRKRQIQEQIFRPVLEHLSKGPAIDLSPEENYRQDYRLLLYTIPAHCLTLWFRDAGLWEDNGDTLGIREERATEWVRKELGIISSRISLKNSFVISSRYCRLHLDASQQALFATETVSLEPSKALNALGPIFRDIGLSQLHPYQGSPTPQQEPEVRGHQGRCTALKLEEIYRENYMGLRSFYIQSRSSGSPCFFLSDLFRLEAVDIIENPLTAAVFGDINVDYVSYLEDDFSIPIDADHIQRRERIDKNIGGKGYLMAHKLDALGTFDGIRLIGKLGIDTEMQHILQDLKQYPRIEPILFFSARSHTGLTFSLRRTQDMRAIFTITHEPSANSRLTLKELEGRLQEIVELSDYIFVSGYCLLDERAEIVERIVELLRERRSEEPRRLVLEFSPRTLYQKIFASSPDKLNNLLESTFLLVFEAGAFPDASEAELTAKPQFCFKLDFRTEKQFERSNTGWVEVEHSFYRSKSSVQRDTVGLTNQLITEYIDTKFWKPRILLCSRSPRRFSLLASVYDKFAIHRYLKAPSPELGDQLHFANIRQALEKLSEVALDKMGESFLSLSRGRELLSNTIKVAITSDLVIMVKEQNGQGIEILDKPDGDDVANVKVSNSSPNSWKNANPVERAGEYLQMFLSGKSHEAWTCTVILQIPRAAFHGAGYLEVEFCKGVATHLPEHVKKRGLDGLLGQACDHGQPGESELLYPNIRESAEDDCGSYRKSFTIEIPCGVGTLSVSVTVLLVRSVVRFRKLDDNEVIEYLASGEWRQKAGGYAIQGNAAYFVESVDGSLSNVVGLPIIEVAKVLDKYGISESTL